MSKEEINPEVFSTGVFLSVELVLSVPASDVLAGVSVSSGNEEEQADARKGEQRSDLRRHPATRHLSERLLAPLRSHRWIFEEKDGAEEADGTPPPTNSK